jgi:type II secretory pathway pseudopilin PulG
MRKGFTLVEVVVATGLLLLVGTALTTLLVRSETTARSSEAAEAAALFARTMALQAQNAPPDWLPQTEGASVPLTQTQIASILNQVPRTTFASPDLYEVRVTRNPPTPQGLASFTAEVCVRPAAGPVCVTTNLLLAASSAHVPPPQGVPVPPPSGRAVVLLSITGPNGGIANVSLAGQTYTRFELYTREVSPGTVTLTAENTADGRYTYTASPSRESATLSAGTSRSFSVTYTCATGAATFTAIPPPGYRDLPQGTVTLQPGGTDISRGGLVPYLAPQRYTVNARDVRSGSYTYSPRVSPASDFTITPCQTQSVTVTYAPVTGALRLGISKPQSMSANPRVRVTGPDPSLPQTLTESATLENLVPGQYGVSPEDILDNGVRFRGTTSPGNPTVQAGQTAAVQVDYAPVSAKLTIVLQAGGQGYPSPQVRLQGPRLNRNLGTYGTHSLDDLAPGDYTLRASPVQDNLYTYAPAPLERATTLVAGERKTTTLTYQPTTGALRVSVTGVPQGATPRVALNGTPLAFDGTGQATVPYLAPGTYTLLAENVSHGGYVYAPTSPTTSVSVAAGSLATQPITYARLNGTVTVTVSGLPTGVAPDVVLTLPNGSTRTVGQTGTTTFTGMPTGTYSLAAREVVANGITYQPTVSPASGTLTNGGNLNFSVTYQVLNGILSVTIDGLPGSVGANVSVTGPSGYAQTLVQRAQLSLPPGSYTVSAQPVSANLQTSYGALIYTFKPSPSTPQTVQVQAGNVASVRITYVKASGNVRLTVSNPSGSSAHVALTGPGGFSQTLVAPPGTNAFAFNDVPTGTYSASGQDVANGGYTYKATPVSGNVNQGEWLPLALTYSTATGALQVVVSAPQGVPAPTVRLLDDQRREVGQFSGARHTFSNLLPGSYQVVPDPVTDGAGFVYQANPVNTSVTAGQTARAQVSYVKQSAFVEVAISGLPTGASANVTLSSPRTTTLVVPGTVEVPLGTYTISVGTVNYGGYPYAGSATPASFNLSVPGSTQTVRVLYREASGSITLQVSGLPQRTSVDLTLTSGATNRTSTCSNGTCTFSRLPTGVYTLSAPGYTTNLYHYTPTANPTQYNLANPGDALSGTVVYTPATGAVEIAVSGPSSMPSPTVTLRDGQGNIVATYSGARTFSTGRLRPGTYTLVALTVTDGSGFTYVPSPASASLTVNAGQTASASITYTRQADILRLSVSGLPSSSATVRVNVSGPVNRQVVVGNTSGYDIALPPGRYTVTPEEYSPNGGTLYKSNPPSTVVTVTSGGVATASFTYTPQDGTLRLSVSGLPSSSATVRVNVSGPVNRQVVVGNTSGYDIALPPGRYTVTPEEYSPNGGTLYKSNPPSTVVTVTSGGVATASFTYTPQDGTLRLSVSGLPSSSATVRVNVSGPVNRQVVVGNTSGYDIALPPGRYTVTPEEYSPNGGTLYKSNPPSTVVTVTSGGVATASFTYTPQDGTLRLSVSGLPSSSATVRVNVSGPVNRQVVVGNTSGYDIALPPGRYTVTPEEYSPNGGTLYKSNPPSTVVTVTSGGVATASFTYTPQDGTLRLSVSGLPSSSATVRVNVSGPVNRQVVVGNTSGYDIALPPGRYTVTPEEYSPNGGTLYKSNPPSTVVTVTSGGVATASFTYWWQSNGTLRLSISGLPWGATVWVTVTGPRWYAKTFPVANGTYQLTDLTPGSYTIQGSDYSLGCIWVYRANPNPVTTTVRAGETAEASLNYYQNYSPCW